MTNNVALCRDDGGFFRHAGVGQYLGSTTSILNFKHLCHPERSRRVCWRSFGCAQDDK
ncbi:MAG: hypothetical protein P8H31_06215 [Porticoccaceae bacterium]|nr:hypothetical protein [Porticoccaceae bacterium]